MKVSAKCTHRATCNGDNEVVVSFTHLRENKPVVCDDCKKYQREIEQAPHNTPHTF
jgi:hypothetical protein